MNGTVCPNHPPGHVWDNGLACCWCDAIRTPEEAIVSGLSSRRGGNATAARTLLEAYRVAVLSKAGVEYEDCTVCGAARGVGKPCNTCAFKAHIAAEAGEKATPAGATATPAFFQPGRTYVFRHDGYTAPELIVRFRAEHVTRHPDRGHLRAIGWSRTGEPGAKWHGDFQDEGEFDGWSEVGGSDA